MLTAPACCWANAVKAPRVPQDVVLGALLDLGASTAADLAKWIYANGVPPHEGGQRSRDFGTTTINDPKDPVDFEVKLNALVSKNLAIAIASEKNADGHQPPMRYAVHPSVASVWVVYIGHSWIYAGAFGADSRPIKLSVDEDGKDVLAIKQVRGNWSVSQLPTLSDILLTGLKQLAEVVKALQHRKENKEFLPANALEPSALAIALPAALDPQTEYVTSTDPSDWAGSDKTIQWLVRHHWRGLVRDSDPHRRLLDLPADGEPIVVESDVVCDTLGAMYSPGRRFSLVLDSDSDALAHRQVVLGVKHSEAVRSACVTRGPADLHRPALGLERKSGLPRELRRQPGQRRDIVYRGAYGDAQGLGHVTALVKRAAATKDNAYIPESLEFVNIDEFTALTTLRCSCNATEPPHLQAVARLTTVLKRLGISPGGSPSAAVDELTAMLDSPDEKVRLRAGLVLQETGRLLAHAIEGAVRLYDPHAVVLSGSLPFYDPMWKALEKTGRELGIPQTPHDPRLLLRGKELEDSGSESPLGPCGAAWLALDTWAFPMILSKVKLPSKPPKRKQPENEVRGSLTTNSSIA